MSAPEGTASLKAVLDVLPGAVGEPYVAPRGTTPVAILYKIGGKIFAILSQKGDAYVVVKAPSFVVDLLRDQYKGVGRRTHLDPRHWIALDLEADVPADEAERLAIGSYGLVRQSLSRKAQAALPPWQAPD